MPVPSKRELELNELRWWSGWAEVKCLGKSAYVLTSSTFREPFFNRACFLECSAVPNHLAEAEKLLRRSGMPLTVTVNQSCSSARKTLTNSGYRTSETMISMVLSRHPRIVGNAEVRVREMSARTVDEWAEAYLLSFYEDRTLLPHTSRVVRRLVRNRSASLLEARLGKAVAGVLAVFRTPRLAGVYCVGTVPSFRRKGVAGALLAQASEIAAAEGRRMMLQTLTSDDAEGFYKKRGFVELYRKQFMEKQS